MAVKPVQALGQDIFDTLKSKLGNSPDFSAFEGDVRNACIAAAGQCTRSAATNVCDSIDAFTDVLRGAGASST